MNYIILEMTNFKIIKINYIEEGFEYLKKEKEGKKKFEKYTK